VVSVFATLLAVWEPAWAKPTVGIGLLLDLSGSTGEAGKAARRVSEMAVDAVNAEGGVDGRLVRLVAFDTGGDPIRGKEGVRDLVSVEEVCAVVGPADWATAMMTKPFFEDREIPVMMLTWEDSVIRGGKYGLYDYIFKLPLKRETALERILAFLRAKGCQRVGLVVGADVVGREIRESLERVGPSHGISEVTVASLVPDQTITESIERIARRNPQAVISWCPLPEAAAVTRVVRGLEMDVPLFQCHEISPQAYVDMAGRAAEGTFTVSNKMSVWKGLADGDLQKERIREFADRYTDLYRYGSTESISPFDGYVWDSVMILVQAMREAGTEGASLRDAIEGTYRHVGLGGIYGFTHEDHNGLDPDSVVVIRADGVHGGGTKGVGSWRLAN
jgi:branched-chain amino acid transport system substrate-binding protein